MFSIVKSWWLHLLHYWVILVPTLVPVSTFHPTLKEWSPPAAWHLVPGFPNQLWLPEDSCEFPMWTWWLIFCCCRFYFYTKDPWKYPIESHDMHFNSILWYMLSLHFVLPWNLPIEFHQILWRSTKKNTSPRAWPWEDSRLPSRSESPVSLRRWLLGRWAVVADPWSFNPFNHVNVMENENMEDPIIHDWWNSIYIYICNYALKCVCIYIYIHIYCNMCVYTICIYNVICIYDVMCMYVCV